MNQDICAAPALAFTGERFTPEVRGAIWHEHWHRYVLAQQIVRGLRVLDAACGEGYGAFLLAQTAQSVAAVDLSEEAIVHARDRYHRDNLAFIQGSVTRLPLPDACIDVITSFETIEHLTAQEEMLQEFRRVLAPRGVLVLSSPNKPVYGTYGTGGNEYHVRELDRAELATVLAPVFPQQRWYGQAVLAHSVLWAETPGPHAATNLQLADDAPAIVSEPAAPVYFLVVAGAAGVVLPSLPPLSLFADPEHSLLRTHEQLQDTDQQRNLVLHLDLNDARKIGRERQSDLVLAVNALSSERQKVETLRARVGVLESQADVRELELGAQREDNAQLRARIAFRESFLGWLRWPLARLKARLAGAR